MKWIVVEEEDYYMVVKEWDKHFYTEREAQAFADQLNTKCLSTDPAWAAKAEERISSRRNINTSWDGS